MNHRMFSASCERGVSRFGTPVQRRIIAIDAATSTAAARTSWLRWYAALSQGGSTSA